MRLSTALLSMLLFVGVNAKAASTTAGSDPQHELVLNAQQAGLSFSDPTFAINLAGGWRYKLMDGLQLTVQTPGAGGVTFGFGGAKTKVVQLLVGPTFSFGDMWNAFYVTVGGGIAYASTTSTTTGVTTSATNVLFGGALGKRCNIYNGFNWSPELWIWKSTAALAQVQFHLNLLSFSYAF